MVAQVMEMDVTQGAKIVSARKEGSNRLLITVQCKTLDQISGIVPRKVAYEHRGDYGFDAAGIESYGGPYPVDTRLPEDKQDEPLSVKQATEAQLAGTLEYRRVFSLVRPY